MAIKEEVATRKEQLKEAVEKLLLCTEGDEYWHGYELEELDGCKCEHTAASIKETQEKATPEAILTLAEEVRDAASAIYELNEQLDEARLELRHLAHHRDEYLVALVEDETDDES